MPIPQVYYPVTNWYDNLYAETTGDQGCEHNEIQNSSPRKQKKKEKKERF